MSNQVETQVEAQVPTSLKEAIAMIVAMRKELDEVKSNLVKPNNVAAREMKDEDAIRILTGDLKDAKHNAAADTLGLSYGQVYSCRGEYTFKHVHKQLREQGFKNPWIKK